MKSSMSHEAQYLGSSQWRGGGGGDVFTGVALGIVSGTVWVEESGQLGVCTQLLN